MREYSNIFSLKYQIHNKMFLKFSRKYHSIETFK